ncbi:MAG: hypothetical protein ABI200_06480, partial [Gaiellales bacterium]
MLIRMHERARTQAGARHDTIGPMEMAGNLTSSDEMPQAAGRRRWLWLVLLAAVAIAIVGFSVWLIGPAPASVD